MTTSWNKSVSVSAHRMAQGNELLTSMSFQCLCYLPGLQVPYVHSTVLASAHDMLPAWYEVDED